MDFLSPWSALVAAGITIPLLLLLYVLKLRRRRLEIPTTMLWQRSFDDLEVNTPFQRLRLTWLFLVQLAVLLALLIALARPVTLGDDAGAPTYVLLVDVSASMQALAQQDGDVETTRFELARQAALDIVRERSTRGRRDAGLVVAVGRRPRLLTDFEDRAERLRSVLDAMAPTDEEADLEAALQLIASFSPPGESTEAAPPDVYFLSDGSVREAVSVAGFIAPPGRFEYRPVGAAADGTVAPNVGIVTLAARRSAESPGATQVFVRVVNDGAEPVTTTLTVLVNDRTGDVTNITVPAASEDAPGESAVTFDLDVPDRAIIRVRQSVEDLFSRDDTAAAVLPAPRRPRVVVVYGEDGPDPFLVDLIEQSEPERIETMSAASFAALSDDDIDAGRRFDFIVFDRTDPARLPGVPTLTFGGASPEFTRRPPTSEGGRRVLSWLRRHPLLRHVDLDDLVFAGAGGLEAPPDAVVLASGPDGPVMAALERRGTQHVVVGFALGRSTWPREVGFAVFTQNVLDAVATRLGGAASRVERPGQPITVRVDPARTEVRVDGPDGFEAVLPVAEANRVSLPALRSVGLYRVDGALEPDDRIAVSLLSDVESDLRPRPELRVITGNDRGATSTRLSRRERWPWFVAAAFGLLVFEWIIYCVRLR